MDFLSLCAVNLDWERNTQLSILIDGEPYPSNMSLLAAKALYKDANVLWFKSNFVCLAVT